MRELVNVIVAVVKDEFLQDPAVRQEATRRLLAAGKPTHTVRGHLSKNYLASVYMAVPLWGHDVLNDVKEGGNEYFSNADRLRYTNEVAEGSFLARMFMPVRKDETTLMPAIFSIDGKHTLAFHEAMQIMVGTNLSSDENRDITYDREYLFLIQKSCGHFVEKGRNKINKELYERCWFFEHQKALQEKLTYFTNRNSFDLNNDNASEEEKKQDADNRDGLIPIIQSQKGVLREVLVESPLCKPNNNKKCYSALHAPSYAKVRKLTDKEDRQKLESLVISKERVSPQHTLSPSQTKGEAVPLLNKDTNTVSILQSAVHMNFVFTVAETFFDYPQKLQCRVIFSQEEDERPTTSTSSIFQFPPAVPVDPLLQTVRSNDHSGKAEQEKSVYDLYWSARLFTAGWNSYAPTEVIGYKFDVEQALMDFYAEDEIVKEVKPSVENQTTVSNSTSHSGNTTADNNNTKTNTTVRDSGSSKKPSASQKQENSTQVDTLVELQSKTTLRMHEQLLKHKKKENNEHSFGLGSRRELSLFLELNEIDNFKGLFSFP
ncbi:hypothetical protein AGDE_17056 [Angomonas deanei]|nr:hypothetical protein AGDE_17056 [Angomonas deanei]|eukprot:EPY15598.1 hypothetical protein AGDE_17056 [Angomonas deanei]